MNVAIIFKQDDTYIVDNMIVVSNTTVAEQMRTALGADYAIPVGIEVEVGNIYDPTTGVFTNADGERVYPPLSTEEELAAVRAELAATQDELEMTQAAVVELAEIVAGGE